MCTSPHCTKTPRTKGSKLCEGHYKRQWRYGDAGKGKYALGMTIQEYFWQYVQKTPECWEWGGGYSKGGYGVFWWHQTHIYAHRFSFEEAHHCLIPKEFQIDHLCRNRSCVNPSHLELVTSRENTRRGNAGLHNKGKPYWGRNRKIVMSLMP